MKNCSQSNDTSALWNRAIDQFKEGVAANARARMARMSDNDIARYKALRNLPPNSNVDILKDLINTGKFRGSSAAHADKSKITDRLAWASVQATSFGKPWLELFYECEGDQEVECFVSVFGLGRREKDMVRKIWVLELNDGLWECFGASEPGLRLITLDQKWMACEPIKRSRLWPEVCSLLQQDISFSLRYGDWDETFKLRLKLAKGIDMMTAMESLRLPKSSGVFNMPRFEPGFPFSWVISR